MIYFGNLSNVNPLECILMKNQQCKVRPEIVNANNNNPIYFSLLALRQINVAVIVIILMIDMQEFVLLML